MRIMESEQDTQTRLSKLDWTTGKKTYGFDHPHKVVFHVNRIHNNIAAGLIDLIVDSDEEQLLLLLDLC